MFERNLGHLDRIIRLALAVVIIIFAIFLELYPLMFMSAFLLFTVATSFCGFYKLFGLSTCKTDLEEKK